ncbi:MAG: DUF2147 domain-containing protein [Rudaea sp.]
MLAKSFFLGVIAALCAAPALAAETSPVGTWTTFTDDHKAKSHVEIFETGSTLGGKVTEIMISDKGPNPVCDACDGDMHNKPVLGMQILRDFKKSGDDLWEGGTCLKPANGKLYKCKIHLIDGGKKLEVRGFIGFALLGETQVWERSTP